MSKVDDGQTAVGSSAPVAEEKKEERAASIAETFSQADAFDYVLMFLGTIGGLITGFSIPFFNVLFGRMLDNLNGNPNSFSDTISFLCIAFCIVAACNLVSGWMQVGFWTRTGERQTQKFRENYVKAILSQEIGWFDVNGANELSTKVAELTGKVQDGIGKKMGDLCQYVSQVIFAFIIAFYYNWRLTLVLLASFPLIAGAGAFMITAITNATQQSLAQYSAAGGLATESLGAIRTVTALNAQPDVISRYRKFLFDAMKVGITKGLNVGLGNGLLFGACFLTYSLGFWFGGNLVASAINHGCTSGAHCATGGKIMSVFFCVIMGSMGLGQIAPPLSSFTQARAAIFPIIQVIKRTPLIDGFSEAGEKPTGEVQGRVEFVDVHFAYPSRPGNMVCKGYNLTLEAGHSTALVGVSGSGKSTVINLLLRFYDPNSGSVLFDGRDVRNLNIRWLRSQIGYVGQEPVLFAGPILDNIAYGLDAETHPEVKVLIDPNSTEEQLRKARSTLKDRIVEAAKLANAHEFISRFPQGYDTDVGSNGLSISGGQKQRIAIARALVKKPSVLLLDEATSALDAASEKLVQESIDSLQKMKSQTTIIIAHRLSTIRQADQIAVVSNGVIAELGNHDHLFAKPNGIYADLVKLQMSSMGDLEGVAAEDEVPIAEGNIDDVAEGRARGRTDSSERGRDRSGSHDSTGKDGKDKSAKKAEVVEEPPIEASEAKLITNRMWGLVLAHPFWLIIGFLGAAVFGAVFPCWGLMLARSQQMFYLGSTSAIRKRASLLACYYILLGVVAFFSATLQFWGIAQVAERVTMKLRSDMFEAILRREIGFFDKEENAIGNLTTRLANDSRLVNKCTGEVLAKQLQACFTLVIGIALGLAASWKITLVVLSCFPLSIAASAIQMQAIAGQGGMAASDGDNGAGGIISTAFTNMRTVSAFSVQHKVASQYAQLTREITNKRVKGSDMAGVGFGGSNMILFLIYALLFWYGSRLISKGEIVFEELMQAILCLMLGALGLGQAFTDLGDQKEGVKAARRIFQAVDEGILSPIDGLSTEGLKPATRPSGRIELVDVNFTYPTRPDVAVCKNYNLTIEPGEVVALVGPSGSGKSTIMNLLLRFYDPASGKVLLDGVDVKTLNVRWLRSQIGYVGQEPVLFQGSVASNIAKGRGDFGDMPVLSLEDAIAECQASVSASADAKKGYQNANQPADIEMAVLDIPEDVLQAAKDSNAHDFIMQFAKKYETDVGEGSIMVSGGQKQRIAIARALIKRPAVLLLDEATSALDATSEKLVQESIDALQQSKQQTTIVIAHRLTTIMNADKIAVIDKGAVVELGTHDQLLALDGLYATLWYKQKGGNKSPVRANIPNAVSTKDITA